MYNLKNDYSEGAHPNILNRLIESNFDQQLGYGDDEYSLQAKQVLKEKLKNRESIIYFVSGGTQANLLVISSLLRVHEAVISVQTGHIFVHETGAIESIGHRIVAVNTANGKLSPVDIEKVLDGYSLRPHTVKPRMVYISNSTEIGTIYFKEELIELSNYCKKNDLLLFMDGARIGHALTAEDNDLELSDIANMTDVFYIGGTKNGALLGEAIVYNKPHLAAEFDYVMKQKGAMLAKGRVLGIQFLELFSDNLYFDLAKHANNMAMKLSKEISELGYAFLIRSTTNQIFPILPVDLVDRLAAKYQFYIWRKIDEENVAIRLITSWATVETKIDEFIADLS